MDLTLPSEFRRFFASMILLSLLFLPLGVPVAGAEVDRATFVLAERELSKGMHSPDLEERERAIEEFARVPDVRTFGTLFKTAVSATERRHALERGVQKNRQNLVRMDRASTRRASKIAGERMLVQSKIREVASERENLDRTLEALQAAAARALAHLSGPELASALSQLEAGGIRNKEVHVRGLAVRILSRLVHSQSCRLLRSCLDAKQPPSIRVLAVQALGNQATAGLPAPEFFPPLTRALADASWQVRASAIEGISRIRSKEAIDALIGALEHEQGRLREDLHAALFRLTGKRFNGSGPLWSEWWKNEREPFRFREKTDGEPTEIDRADRYGASFYGIETCSRKLVFVLDTSGSMADRAEYDRGSKLTLAKEELLQTLGSLVPPCSFNVIFFGDTVRAWRPDLVEMNEKSLGQARRFIEKEQAGGGTNLHGALQEAFATAGLHPIEVDLEATPDTIFLLSDGEPTRGDFLDPADIVRQVEGWNQTHKIRIHTIGMGRDHNRELMSGLAKSTGGRFVVRR